jgi:outer membrane protein assembly factor BamB
MSQELRRSQVQHIALKLGNLVRLSVFLLLLGILAFGCGSPISTSERTTPLTQTSPLTSAPASSLTSPSSSSLQPPDNWPTYHRDLARSGFDAGVSPVSSVHRLWTSVSLDGDVYAEPLVVGGKVLAATERDSVYALDFQTGKVLWQVNLGTAVPGSEMSCGNIDPSGITGTPAADPTAGRLYVVARIQPNHHELFVLDIETGAVVSHRTVDPPGSDPRVQQQRSALALSNGRVYIAFGGLYGDCGAYNGWMVGAPIDGTGQLTSYRVPAQRGAGLWAPSGPAVDAAGSIYVTSGNGFSNSSFDFGNSVIRLAPDLSVADWFAPANWQALNAGDVDLGSMGPTLLQRDLIFQAGKEGTGYLLRADSLGHVGGEVFSGNIGQGAYGGTAYAAPYIFIPGTGGLVALIMDASPAFETAWSGPNFFAGPPVVAGGTVLTVDIGSGTLYGFTLDKGAVLFKVELGPVVHFATPALSGGRIFVAASRQIVCLGP